MSERRISQALFWGFLFAITCSFAAMYFQLIVHKSFEVFTDEETVPEATDFYGTLFGSNDSEE